MKIILSLITFVLSHLCIAQYYPDCTRLFEVNSNNGLSIRKEANVNSDIIFNVPNGFRISACKSSESNTEINGVKGSWIRVKYQNESGYMFDAYLKEIRSIQISSPYSPNPEATYHDISKEQIDNNPSYQQKRLGLFRSKSDIVFYAKEFYYRDYLDTANHLDLNKLSNDGLLFNIHYQTSKLDTIVTGKEINKTLLPGYSVSIRTKYAKYILATLGTVTGNENKNELDPLSTVKDFRLVVRKDKDGSITEHEIMKFEATRWYGSGFLNRIHLKWIGDIDGDGELDIYLSFSEHHECYNDLLFLSSEAEEGHIVRLVDNFEHCGG